MYARAKFIGRATKNAEACELPSGKIKADFGIACNPYSKDETVFFDITAYDKLAELCGKYVTKGKLLYLECNIKPRSYEDKNGNKRNVTDYVIREIEFLSSENTAKQSEEQPRRKPTLQEYYDTDEMPPF